MDSWQEEKDKLDRKKVLIFAESPRMDYSTSQVSLPYELKKELRINKKFYNFKNLHLLRTYSKG